MAPPSIYALASAPPKFPCSCEYESARKITTARKIRSSTIYLSTYRMKSTTAGKKAQVRPRHVATDAYRHFFFAVGGGPIIWFVLQLRPHGDVVQNHILGSGGDESRGGGWIQKAVQSTTAAIYGHIHFIDKLKSKRMILHALPCGLRIG